jgi:sugar phosphate isomerase/epimerase
MIKIGCNFLSLQNTDVETFLDVAHDLRLDIVDFHHRAFTSTDPEYLGSIKLQCLKYGLPIGYIGVSGLFVGNAAERAAHAQDCKDAIDLAAFLGSPIIRAFCGVIPEKNGDGDDPWPAMTSGYQEIADYAATKGIAVGLQNHPSTGDDMLRIRRETDRENFSFIMDTGQWVGSPGSGPRGETDPDIDFYEFMEQTVPYALYVRTKFYKVESGKEEWLDYERIAEILKSVNYNGCISIVYEGDHPDRIDQVRKAASQLRTLLAGY